MSSNIVLFSGGKDSLALALYLLERGENFRLVYNAYGYEPSFYLQGEPLNLMGSEKLPTEEGKGFYVPIPVVENLGNLFPRE